MKSISTVHIDLTLGFGGGQCRLRDHLPMYSKANCESLVILNEKNTKLRGEIEKVTDSIILWPNPFNPNPITYLIAFFKSYSELKRKDILFCYSPIALMVISIAKILMGLRGNVVFYALTGLGYRRRALVENNFFRFCDLIAFNSCFTRKTYLNHGYRGAIVGPVVYDHVPLVKRDRIRKENTVCGYLGRINPRKRVHLVVDSCFSLVGKDPNTEVWLVGGSSKEQGADYLESVKARVPENLSKQYIFTGHVDNPIDYLAAYDVLLLATDEEGLGRVVVEAVSLGIPIVADRSGGPIEIKEMVPKDYPFYLVDYSNTNEAAKAIGLAIERKTVFSGLNLPKFSFSNVLSQEISFIRGFNQSHESL